MILRGGTDNGISSLVSRVFGEQPSAAKWGILGTNDSYFNSQIGSDFSSGTTSTVWWEEIARTTLGSAGDTITVSSIPARAYLYVYCKGIATGGTLDTSFRFNNDSGTSYAARTNNNGTFSDSASTTSLAGDSGATDSGQMSFSRFEILNFATKEKAVMYSNVSQDASGAATVPVVFQSWAKWINTSVQINRIDWANAGTGDFAIGSEIVILGHD